MTTKERIMEVLKEVNRPLAVHEFPYIDTNENTVATRLTELARIGAVKSQYRQGKRYKEWYLPSLRQGLLI
jgi:predicted Zn-ribbon and HTH transcriptional regulator